MPLETREVMAVNPLAGPINFDFVKRVNAGATDPIQVSLESYTAARSYGWTALVGGAASGSLVVGRTGTFSVALPNGDYEVVAAVGGTGDKLGVRLQAEGQAVPQGVLSPDASLPTFAFKSRVSDGRLDINIIGPGNGIKTFALDKIEIKLIAAVPANPIAVVPADPIVAVPSDASARAISLWRSQMLQYGRKHADQLIADQDGPIDPALGATYYDAARIFYQIADDTGDPYWLGAAKVAVKVYRDRYVLPNNGGVPGYWNFARGLAEDFRRTGDVASRDAVLLLAKNAAFANDSTPLAWTVGWTLSREVAFALSAQVEAESLGAARRPRTALLAEQAMGHIDQWTAPSLTRDASVYVRPFMVGLTAEALIRYWEVYQDPRVLPKITQALDWIWTNTWVPASNAFKYTDIDTSSGGTTPAPDLNLLIAPAYAWVYQRTGDVTYRDKADAIFAGGVNNAWLSGAKQFNQNYRWSFDYLKWRSAPPGSF